MIVGAAESLGELAALEDAHQCSERIAPKGVKIL